MIPLEVGKLYSCSGYFLLLYPGKEAAAEANYANAYADFAAARAEAALWSKKLQKPVSFCDPETPLLILSVKEKYVEVLAGDRKVWIINDDWLKIKEITDDTT